MGPRFVPLNLIGDFGGGALYLAMGLLAALVEARVSGQGQVVDAAMVDGVASLMTMHFGYRQAGSGTTHADRMRSMAVRPTTRLTNAGRQIHGRRCG